jgi:hypothetical protein
LLAFAAVGWRAYRVPGGTSIGFGQVLIVKRLNAVVAVNVDGSNIDGIAETAVPVACGIQLASCLGYGISYDCYQR